ncbi:MAG: SRPBCC family protein [Gammaproteobacteria bacterium]
MVKLAIRALRRGAVVFQVRAPAEVVWSVIFDFSSYPQWLEGVDEAKIYRKEGDDIYVRFKVRHWVGARYTYLRPPYLSGSLSGMGHMEARLQPPVRLRRLGWVLARHACFWPSRSKRRELLCKS